MKFQFNITYSINGKCIYVETNYNTYHIYPDAVKGLAIYQEIPGSPNVLIKSYTGNKIMTAIQYLMRKESFISQ